MIDIAKYIRIFEADPDDDFVIKRQTALNAIAAKLSEIDTFDGLMTLAQIVTDSIYDPELLDGEISSDIEQAVKAESPAFLAEGNELQIAMMMAVGVLEIISEAEPTSGPASRADYLALAIWSGLSFNKPLSNPKIESLRQELLSKSSDLFLSSAEKSRQRLSASKMTIKILSANAALDREELDILWWVFDGWSNLAKARLSMLSECSASIIAAFEVASRLRRIPAEAHRQLSMRYISDNASLSLKEVIVGLDDEVNPLSKAYQDETLAHDNPRILPLMHAIVQGKEAMNGMHMSLSVTDWTTRALIEGALVQLSKLPEELI